MYLVHEQNALIADDPEGFADAVVRLWTEPEIWHQLSVNGRENLREHFSVEAAGRRIDELLEWAGLSMTVHGRPGDSQISVFVFPYVTHAIGAVLLLIAGTVIARFLERSVLIGAVNAKLQYARMLSLGIKWLVLVLTAAMVLDHLQIGGGVVELAFGILFGGIVLTLALAVGLGSRNIVSRSLERSASLDPLPGEPDYRPHTPPENLRHF